MWAPAAAVAAAVVALAAWSAWQRWQLLAVSPFPLGVDGYFYPIQLRSLLERGQLAYPASPLAFYLMAPFAALTDPISGAKLAAAILGAAIAGPAYAVGAHLGGSRGAGLVAAVLATTSVGSSYLTIEFVKNGIGLTVALTALWLALRATDRPTRLRIAAAIAGLLAAYATHKMAAAIVLVVAVPAALASAAARGALRGRRLLIAIGAVTGAVIVALSLGALFPQRFLSTDDTRLLRDLVSSTPHWTAPALVFSSGELALGRDALLGIVLALSAAVALVLRTRRARAAATDPNPAITDPRPAATDPRSATTDPRSATTDPRSATTDPSSATTAPRSAATDPRRAASERSGPPDERAAVLPAAIKAAAWTILLLTIAIGLPFLAVTDRQGLGFRLRIAAFVPAALTAAIAIRAVLPRALRRDRILAAVALALAVLRQPGTRLEGSVITHPALVAATRALDGHVPADTTLIVPERHIAFMVAWYTGAPIAIRPERIPKTQRARLLPLHFIRADSALDRALLAARAEPSLAPPVGFHPRHPNGLVLVPEPTWDWILTRLPAKERARFTAWPTI
jgi:hypothetical protein